MSLSETFTFSSGFISPPPAFQVVESIDFYWVQGIQLERIHHEAFLAKSALSNN
jgi:hypothetical protein